MKFWTKLVASSLLAIGISACSGGGSSSSSSSVSADGNSSTMTESNVFVPVSAQIRTPGSAYVSLLQSSTQNLSQNMLINANLSGKVAETNSCFVIQPYADGKNYSLVKNSAPYYSTAALSFTVANTCSTAQTMSGVGVKVTGFELNNSPASVNYIAQNSSDPYLTLSYTTSGSDLAISLSTPACTGDYCSWAEFPANATQSFTINAFNTSPSGITSAAVTDVTLDGETPPPPSTSGNLALTVDTSALKSICTSDSSCDLKLNILNSSGVAVESALINPYESSNYTIVYSNLLTGTTSVQVDTSSYPSAGASGITYTTQPSSGSVNITSNNTSNIGVTFQYTAPVQMGTLAIKVPTIAESATFASVGVLSGTAMSSGGHVYGFAASLNSQVNLSVPANDTYTVSIQGVADPLTATYYAESSVITALVKSGQAQAVDFQFNKLKTSRLHKVNFTVIGNMPAGQIVKFGQDSSLYKYNNDALSSTTYSFVESPVALTVTVGDTAIIPNPAVVDTTTNAVSIDFGTTPVAIGNPYDGSAMYINPDYAAEVNNYLATDAALKAKAQSAGFLDSNGSWNISTAVWLDKKSTISSVGESHGIAWNLAQAYSQAIAKQKPVVITFVVYDLPDRDCAAFSSNGEIVVNQSIDPDGSQALTTYKTTYIDPVYNEISNYYSVINPNASSWVRVSLVIEPDSLPNIITNATDSNYPTCNFVAAHKIYQQGVEYALNQFAKLSYTAMYLDVAHSGWMGWNSNAGQMYKLFNSNPSSSGGLGNGFNSVRGFITNTANYTPLTEAFTEAQYLSGNTILQSNFYQWNDAYSEAAYIAEIMSIQSNGSISINSSHQFSQPSSQLYKNMHFLVDTSRNGWATTVTTNTDGTTYARKDQRHHRGNWCNIQDIVNSYASNNVISPGMGSIPQANPILANPLYGTGTLPMDAYVWIKPPGESDGNYSNDDGVVTGDQMCGPTNGGFHTNNAATDALQDTSSGAVGPAPHAGTFFPQAFKALLLNAHNSDE